MGVKFHITEKNPTKNCLKNVQVKIFDLRKIDHRGNTSTVCVYRVKNTDIHLPDTLQNAHVQFNLAPLLS